MVVLLASCNSSGTREESERPLQSLLLSALMRGPQKKHERSSNTFLGGHNLLHRRMSQPTPSAGGGAAAKRVARATWRGSLTALVAALQVDVELGRP